MDDRQREIDQRIRRAQRQMFLNNLREHWLLVVIGAGMLGALGVGVAWNSAPDRLEATVLGTIVNDGGLQATRRGTQYHNETVELPNGATIVINLPADDPVRRDTKMKIEIHEKDFGPLHQTTYRFAGYADDVPGHTG